MRLGGIGMQPNAKLILVCAIALMLSPVANASWRAYGSTEPDNHYDLQGFMFTDPPAVGSKDLYFNVISSVGAPPVVSAAFVNPNVGALGTHNEIPHNEFHQALLGVWTDCNGDGYIGLAESAVAEYHSALLLDTSVCQPHTGSPTRWNQGTVGAWNNYNNWVSEFIPIAGPNASATDVRVYRDQESAVWGDYGVIDAKPTHLSCALEPLPRGTLQDTGGMLNYLDCRSDTLNAGALENFNAIVDAAGDPLGLRFADDEQGHSGALGNQDIGGSEDSSHSAATVFDCGAAPIVRVGDVLNMTPAGPATAESSAHNTVVRPAAPAATGGTPTLAGQANQTSEELEDCDTSNDGGGDVYGLAETNDFNGIDPNNKHEADWNMAFAMAQRGFAAMTAVSGGSAGADENAGVGVIGISQSHWEENSIWLSKPGPGIVKADLSTSQVGLADAYWLTFYARVGPATTSTNGIHTPGNTGVYGSWHCGSFTSGIHNGWNCNTATWNKNQDGSPYTDEFHTLAYPGVTYNVRDSDCYDGSNDLGVPLDPAGLGSNPCS